MNIFFVRHGQSTGNVEKRLQTDDEPLTENGIEQAKNLKLVLDNFDFDLVFTSNMKRCVQTSEIVFSNREIPMVYTENICEKRNGDFEGQLVSEINWTKINEQPFEDRRIPNGETLKEVQVRARKFLDFLKYLNCDNILVVTHGTFIRMILSVVTNVDIESIISNKQISNTEIIKLEYDKTFRLIEDE